MEILNYITGLFTSGFYFPGITFYQLIAGIGLGLVFGAIWYATYWTPILGKPSAWAVLSFSAFFTWIAVCFIQVPLQSLTSQGLNLIWDQAILMRWMMVAIIPRYCIPALCRKGPSWYRWYLYGRERIKISPPGQAFF